MKKLLTCACMALLSVSLFGCSGASNNAASDTTSQASSSQTSTASDSSSAAPQELVVVDSNYTLTETGVRFIAEVENPNSDYIASFVYLGLNVTHADGSTESITTNTYYDLMPNTTMYWQSAMPVDIKADDIIEVTAVANDEEWAEVDQELPDHIYTFNDVVLTQDKYGQPAIEGTITMDEDIKLSKRSDPDEPLIVCVFKDAEGHVLDGLTGGVAPTLHVGEPESFSIQIPSNYVYPDYASFEVYAYMYS